MSKKKLLLIVSVLFFIFSQLLFTYAEVLSPEKQYLYSHIIQATGIIKPDEFPIKNQVVEKAEISFLFPTKESLRNYKTVIIVLGSKPLDAVTPTIDSVYRVLSAMRLMKTYPSALLVFSGGKTLPDISEAEIMGAIAWSRGLDPRKIILEENSRTTLENAKFCYELFKNMHLQNIFLVSRRGHLPRALNDFRKYEIFKDIQAVDCGATLKELVAQLEEYLPNHENQELKNRISKLRAEDWSGNYR